MYDGGWHAGAFNIVGAIRNQQGPSGSQQGGGNLRFDASSASAIYGSSSTVTPLSQSTLMLMKY